MDISIIIPSYNTQDTINATLQCLVNQDTSLAYEIIVVDCSEHNLVKEIAKTYPDIQYAHEEQRFNPGKGRNIGAKLATGELLVFIDSDVQLEANSLNAAWDRFKQQGLEIFGGALELNTQACDNTAAYLEHYFFNHESQAGRPFCERSNLSSALMCFKRELFISSGGFKDIPRMQDTELTERLKAQGHKLYFCPDITGLQTQDSPFKKVLNKIYINGQNVYYIRYQKNITTFKKLAFLVSLPAISGMKVLRIIVRHLRYQNQANKLRTLTLAPTLFLGGLVWMAGFYHALTTEKGISKNR